MPPRIALRIAAVVGVLAAAIASPVSRSAAAAEAPVFGHVVDIPGSSGFSESRDAVTADGSIWVNTNASDGTAVVYRSTDGGAGWHRTAADPAGQSLPTTDVDIVATDTGRLVTTELDSQGINFRTSYSDDGGRTWTTSTGTEYADTDRPWLAAGPDDPVTHRPRVYLLFHNLASGAVTHNMFVATSTDGGATFGAPVPITLPGQQAWADLQCADSGGPSNITVNQRTGQVYAIFGTRSSAAGGCGASVTGPFEINVVAATRVWVATSFDGNLGSWTQSLAVDDSTSNHIVGMQLAPGALDTAGGLWLVYPESPNPYPDYDGAAIRIVHAPPDLSSWSAPLTVAAGGGPGNVLPHIVAGEPGAVDVAYWNGVPRPGKDPVWYETFTQVLGATGATPTLTTSRLSDVVVDHGTASQLMGACGSGPAAGVENGTICGRSADVWGIALDAACRVNISWPAQSDEPHAVTGTFAAVQSAGPTVCASLAEFGPGTGMRSPAGVTPTPAPAPSAPPPTGGVAGAVTPVGLANTAASAVPVGALLLPLVMVGGVARWRRRRAVRTQG